MSVALFNNGELINTGSDNASNVVYKDTTVESALDEMIKTVKIGSQYTIEANGSYAINPPTPPTGYKYLGISEITTGVQYVVIRSFSSLGVYLYNTYSTSLTVNYNVTFMYIKE